MTDLVLFPPTKLLAIALAHLFVGLLIQRHRGRGGGYYYGVSRHRWRLQRRMRVMFLWEIYLLLWFLKARVRQVDDWGWSKLGTTVLIVVFSPVLVPVGAIALMSFVVWQGVYAVPSLVRHLWWWGFWGFPEGKPTERAGYYGRRGRQEEWQRSLERAAEQPQRR